MNYTKINKINKVKDELKKLESEFRKQQNEKFKNELVRQRNQMKTFIKKYSKFEYKEQLDEFLVNNKLLNLKKFFNSKF